MAVHNTREMTTAVLAVGQGSGRLTRHGSALLFIPSNNADASATDTLVESFLDVRRQIEKSIVDRTIEPGSTTDFADDATIAFALVDWTALTSPPNGPWQAGSGIRVVTRGELTVRVAGLKDVVGVANQPTDCVIDLAGFSSTSVDVVTPSTLLDGTAATDLVVGVVPAGSFSLGLSCEVAVTSPEAIAWLDSELKVAPPSIDEVDVSDVTVPPLDSVSWPDDASSDSTQRRSTRAASAGVRLPDGTIVPIATPLVLGREPQRDAARAPADAACVRIDAATTVSRTHLLVDYDESSAEVTVTDCGSRGCTAVIRSGGGDAEVLPPWTPTPTAVGDTLLLGGPTEVAIVALAIGIPSPGRGDPATGDATLLPPVANALQSPTDLTE